MTTTKVSSKYQVVIPKAIRSKINLQPGQSLEVTANRDGKIVLSPKRSVVDEAYGAGKGLWSKDYPDAEDPVMAYIKDIRSEWDERDARLWHK